MPEQLLHRADIVPILQQVRGKRIPETVARDPLGQPGLRSGRLDSALNDRLMQMVTPQVVWITTVQIPAACGEHELPRPLSRGTRRFPLIRPWQRRLATACSQITLVYPPHAGKMGLEIRHRSRGKHRHPPCRP
jgi:hypothetical protein